MADWINVLSKLEELANKPLSRSRVKGPGFFGKLDRPGEGYSTELSVGVNMDGQEREIPSIVPTLTKEELDHLLGGGRPTPTIMEKAINHARQRIQQKESPFAQRSTLEWPSLK